MTLDQLADLTADKLKALSYAEKEAILKPYFKVTRPERIERVVAEKKTISVMATLSPQKRAAIELLKEQGFDMSLINMKGKKK